MHFCFVFIIGHWLQSHHFKYGLHLAGHVVYYDCVQKRSEASKTTPGTSQKIWHTSTFWHVLCHGCGLNHGRDYVCTHHIFSQILNLSFVIVFWEEKRISDKYLRLGCDRFLGCTHAPRTSRFRCARTRVRTSNLRWLHFAPALSLNQHFLNHFFFTIFQQFLGCSKTE